MGIPILLQIDNLGYSNDPTFNTIWQIREMPIPPVMEMVLSGRTTVPDGREIDGFLAGDRLCYTLVVSDIDWNLNTNVIRVGCDLTDDGDIPSSTLSREDLLTLLAIDGWQFGLDELRKHIPEL